MLEDGRISNRQAVFLIVNTILATSIIFLPGMIFKEARQDAWMSVVLVTVFGVVAGLIIASLGARFPGRTIIQYSGDIVGKPLGKVIGLIYSLFFIYINAFIVREFADMFNINFMPETPVSLFSMGIVFAAAYAVRSGLEVLARVSEIVLPLVLVMLLLIVGLVCPEIDAKLFFPILEKGFMPVLKGAYPPALFFRGNHSDGNVHTLPAQALRGRRGNYSGCSYGGPVSIDGNGCGNRGIRYPCCLYKFSHPDAGQVYQPGGHH